MCKSVSMERYVGMLFTQGEAYYSEAMWLPTSA